MDLGAILLLIAAIILIGLFLALPFFDQQRKHRSSTADHEQSTLLAERDRLLTALQELDFDNALGKIPAEDYPQQRATLLQRGADVLRRLDAFTPQPTAVDVESRIEAAIAARRADSAQVVAVAETVPVVDDELEALISVRRSGRKEKSGGFCPKCGKPVLQSDRFCPNCGKAIQA